MGARGQGDWRRAGTLAEVPLGEVLGREMEPAAVASILAAAARFEKAIQGNNLVCWDYWDRPAHEIEPGKRRNHLLSGSILIGDDDYVEFDLDIFFDVSRSLFVTADVGVFCACGGTIRDGGYHNMHIVRSSEWEAASDEALARSFSSAVDTILLWIEDGTDPTLWRNMAGLPTHP